jgi:hypothetical protein
MIFERHYLASPARRLAGFRWVGPVLFARLTPGSGSSTGCTPAHSRAG